MVHFRGKIKGSLRAVIVAVCCVVLATCATKPDGEQETKQRDTASIRGIVVEQGSETPLAGATVFVVRPSNQPQVRATTDAEGNFALEGLEPGRHLVAVVRDGYVLPGRQNISGLPYRLKAA